MVENNLQLKTPFGYTFGQDFVKEDLSELKKIKLFALTITKKIINITKDDNVLINKDLLLITTKPSFSINIVF